MESDPSHTSALCRAFQYHLSIELFLSEQGSYPYLLLPKDLFGILPEQIGSSSIPQNSGFCWQLTKPTAMQSPSSKTVESCLEALSLMSEHEEEETITMANSTSANTGTNAGTTTLKKISRPSSRYGHGPMEIISIDNADNLSAKDLEIEKRPHIMIGSVSVPVTDTGAGIEPKASSYIPFLTGRSEVCSGIIHLYHDLCNPSTISSQKSDDTFLYVKENDLRIKFVFEEYTVILVVAIPSSLSPAELLAYFDNVSFIDRVRLLKDAAPNRYMALVRFKNSHAAKEFRLYFDGRPFSPLEPEICRVVFVQSVEFTVNRREGSKVNFEPLFDYTEWPSLNTAAGLVANPIDNNNSSGTTAAAITNSATIINPTTASWSSPLKSSKDDSLAIELPICPVCLERMDSSVTGMITIICRHTFHCQCLSRWADSSCPVCRYTLQSEDESIPCCLTCGADQNIWMCLLCGHIGCGRYRGGHAFDHFHQTEHNFALELDSHRVWDYLGDNYVHRLVQSKANGKLVEIPAPDDPPLSVSKSLEDPEYFSSLLVAQLESQRVYFEDRLFHIETSLTTKLSQLKHEHEQELKSLKQSADFKIQSLQDALNTMDNTKSTLELRISELRKERREMFRDLDAERAMNRQLINNQQSYCTLLAQREYELKELREQVADLLAHFDSTQALQNIPPDIRDGHVILKPARSKMKSKK